jgi:hypothetical protein
MSGFRTLVETSGSNMATRTSSSKAAREICEALLKNDRTDKIEKAILPSEVEVIDRLLARGLELEDAYEELYSKLSEHPPALKVFFDQMQCVAAFWSPDANQEARKGKSRLIAVNREIVEAATALAALLEERAELKNHSGFSCDTLYHPVDAIHAAAVRNYSYEHWVKEKLEAITGQFDLKYWPSLGDLVQAIADDAEQAAPMPHDPVTEAGTEGSRAGLADTFRAFFVALEESSARNHGFLPSAFELTDRSTAILVSCALGLGPDKVVDSTYVKRLRQRQREKA